MRDLERKGRRSILLALVWVFWAGDDGGLKNGSMIGPLRKGVGASWLRGRETGWC